MFYLYYTCSSLPFDIVFIVPLFMNDSIIFMNIYSVFFIKIDSSNLKGLWVIVTLGFGFQMGSKSNLMQTSFYPYFFIHVSFVIIGSFVCVVSSAADVSFVLIGSFVVIGALVT